MEPVERPGLQQWVERIRNEDMPVFGRTVQEVRSVTEDESASAGRLSRAVLQDAALTAKVLKLGNSVMFNPSQQSIHTVSRAIVVLGFDLVGQIVLSIQLIDALLSGGLRERVTGEMARCFHAAVQARTAAVARGSNSPEEVFIAALLGHVGDMAFWCFGGKTAQALDSALKDQPEEKPEELQREVLGFQLKHLTVALAKEWKLGELVCSVGESPSRNSIDEQAIAQGYKLAQAAEKGWESPQARFALEQYSEFVGQPLKQITEELFHNACEASRVAAQFGAADAARLIPIPPKVSAVDIAAEVAQVTDPEPDPMLQLKILRDLSMLLASRPSLNEVLQLVLEGIYRGLGMSRAVFALLSADRTKLVGKVALGRDAEKLAAKFVFPLDGRPGEVINVMCAKLRPLWLQHTSLEGLDLERIKAVTGRTDGMLAPIVTGGRAIGFFYADRSVSNPPDEETWQGFQHFVQQASLTFEYVAARGSMKK